MNNDINPMQALVDGLSAGWQRERAETQMTLGALIERLESLPGSMPIEGIADPHSYRGYYCDLAFERAADKITVADALKLCRSAMGEVFQGYKGGDFMMGKTTPVWMAAYGCCGSKILSVSDNGVIELGEDT